MFKKTALACGLLLAAWRPAAAQETPPLPQAVQTNLDRVQEMEGVAYTAEETQKVHQAGQLFTQALDRTGSLLSPTLARQMAAREGQNIRAKLVTIAWDRRTRPEVYEEIEREYLRRVDDPAARLPRSPRLRPEHMTEKYRLPWEYVLLRPPTEDAAAFYDGNARNALAAINNEASLVTLVHNYRMTAQGEFDSQAEARQRLLLGGVSAFRNAQGLRALLECLSLSEDQLNRRVSRRRNAGKRAGLSDEWDVTAYVSTLMGAKAGSGPAEGWQRAITAASREGLSPKQRQLLEKVTRGD
jgi:hypothetical protein